MSPSKEKFLGIAKVSTQFKLHFPEDVAAAMGIAVGDRIGFYQRGDGEVVVRKM